MTAQGATFGKYYLTEKIATGGMAEIYLAKLIGPGGFEKQLVIKQIHPELSGEREFVDMFVTEAKTLVSLSHGNIVPIYELGVVDGTYFIAMDYIDGPTLSSLLNEVQKTGSAFEPAVAVHIAIELLKGLGYAHRKGESVIHRDVSARNVMLSREGEVKLVDFGIAVTAQRVGPKEIGPVGSFPYMSPEQASQRELDHRSDLFSAGILLWEMLTGIHLFAKSDDRATLDAVLSQPIRPPSELRPEIPADLDDICIRALDRNRNDRYQNATDFQHELGRFLYTEDAVVSASTVATLVAKYAPGRTQSASTTRSTNDGGPHTAPMPGLPGRSSGNTRSFATHVQLTQVMKKTPGPSTTPRASGKRHVRALAQTAPAPIAMEPGDIPPTSPLGFADTSPDLEDETREPPTRRLGLVAVALAFAGIGFVAMQFSTQTASTGSPLPRLVREPVAPAPSRAPLPPHAATTTTPPRPATDAGPMDGPMAPRRHTVPRATASAPVPQTFGTIRVGARPWGRVAIDGKPAGDAPGTFRVTTGKHRVEVTHPPSKRLKSFDITVVEDAAHNLGVVDFTQ